MVYRAHFYRSPQFQIRPTIHRKFWEVLPPVGRFGGLRFTMSTRPDGDTPFYGTGRQFGLAIQWTFLDKDEFVLLIYCITSFVSLADEFVGIVVFKEVSPPVGIVVKTHNL